MFGGSPTVRVVVMWYLLNPHFDRTYFKPTQSQTADTSLFNQSKLYSSVYNPQLKQGAMQTRLMREEHW